MNEPLCRGCNCKRCIAYHKRLGLKTRKNPLDTQKKAFGGCEICYGKGYSTELQRIKGKGIDEHHEVMKYCSCDRGEQLRHNVGKLVKVIGFKPAKQESRMERVLRVAKEILR